MTKTFEQVRRELLARLEAFEPSLVAEGEPPFYAGLASPWAEATLLLPAHRLDPQQQQSLQTARIRLIRIADSVANNLDFARLSLLNTPADQRAKVLVTLCWLAELRAHVSEPHRKGIDAALEEAHTQIELYPDELTDLSEAAALWLDVLDGACPHAASLLEAVLDTETATWASDIEGEEATILRTAKWMVLRQRWSGFFDNLLEGMLAQPVPMTAGSQIPSYPRVQVGTALGGQVTIANAGTHLLLEWSADAGSPPSRAAFGSTDLEPLPGVSSADAVWRLPDVPAEDGVIRLWSAEGTEVVVGPR